MATGMEKFDWMCGKESADNLLGFTWDKTHTINNACFSNLVESVSHELFIVLASFILLFVSFALGKRKVKHPYILKYPLHDVRWIFHIILAVILVFQLLEGVITDIFLYGDFTTQPHLYIPACFALLSGILSFVYYHHMEYWETPHMVWLLVIYWLLAITGSVVKLINLAHDVEVNQDEMRYALTVTACIMYSFFLLIDINNVRVMIFQWGDKPSKFPKDLTKEDMRFLQGYTNLLSTALFWWMNWLFSLGYKRALELEDLGSLSEIHTTEHNRNEFQKALIIEQQKANETKKPLNLYRVYLRVYGWRLGVAGIIKFVADTTAFVIPFTLSATINYATQLAYEDELLESPDVKYVTSSDFFNNGITLVIVLFLLSYMRAILLQLHYHLVISESGHIKAAIQAAVYDKALRLSTWTISGGLMTTGQITNHMSVDANNILMVFQYVHSIWSLPYQLLGYLAILLTQLGWSALAGASVFALVFPLQTIFVKKLAVLQKEAMKFSDKRLKQTNEMLQGMKLIKLYAWEEIFLKVIGEARGQEILMMFKSTGWRVLMYTTAGGAPLVVTLVSYGLYQVITGKPLTPDITFASLTVFNNMLVPMFMLPVVFTFYANAVVSTKRLRAFFNAPEIEEKDDGRAIKKLKQNGNVPLAETDKQNGSASGNYKQTETYVYSNPTYTEEGMTNGNIKNKENATEGTKEVAEKYYVEINRGNFTWDKDSDEPILKDINVKIPAGKLTMIVGQVGCGKSTLISAFLGETTTLSGDVKWSNEVGSVSYAAQKPWLLNATLKDNILFGNKFDGDRYEAIIEACSLQADIDILPAGDQTEIGEKGINLSGGQKQRVSVARAMYSPHPVVILDDPLSALDVHVGAHLFEVGIKERLLKEKRSIVLVTHQVQYLESADLIIVMKDGAIQHMGTLESIEKENPSLVESWRGTMHAISEESDAESLDKVSLHEERMELTRQVSQRSKLSMEDEEILKAQKDKSFNKEKGKLMEKEERNRGSVSWRIYWHYIKTFRASLFLLCMFLYISQNALLVVNNFWLSAWSEAGVNITNITKAESSDILKKYLPVYGALTAGGIIMSTISSLVIMLASLKAAKLIHNYMLSSVIHAPLRFFDTTPVGRILNRFSSDTQVIDQKIAMTVNMFLRVSISCLFAIVANAIVSWYFIIAIIPLFVLYLYLMKFFVATSRELQRLESISRSPIFAHFSESLGGLTTIRAYNQEKEFQVSIVQKIEKNNVAFLYLQTSNRWLGTRLDFIGALIVLIAGLVSLSSAFAGSLAPSLVGLSITYALSISNSLNWVIRQAADLEMQMNAIERTSHYTALDSEQYEGSRTPPPSWPDKGKITFEDVHARYAKTLDPVLHGVTVELSPSEKIGICGRTGSGKSSLTLCLFRVIDMYKGRILIDGEDISELPLTTLRRQLAIIPQDPILFNGTIRFNLDPFTERSDAEMWRALEISQLKKVVSDLSEGLDAEVTEGGENFSVGQRQLFCLARAFLRKSKILVMDEATASIDLETDEIVQEVVRTAFTDRTIITIAHRVSTILDSSKIITLDNGKMVEFDSPQALLENEDSIFASLVNSNQ